MEPTRLRQVPYSKARRWIRSGDLLLLRRGRSWTHRLIAAGGRSLYVHAAMAAWWNRDLMCLEMVQWRGGRAVCLSHQVALCPGRWDVYTLTPVGRESVDRTLAVRAMKRLTGTPYGWKALWRVICRHLPLVRWLVAPPTEDPEVVSAGGLPPMPTAPMFCSQAVAWAYRAAGVDPAANLPDRLTEPGDLARSPLFRYRFTLMPD
ncbi:MAG TPA: hypothetical protein PLQ00_09565 [Thermoguttaceae bacterium]|nr:hypothetical protein [Thermoguttaceae bacterium]